MLLGSGGFWLQQNKHQCDIMMLEFWSRREMGMLKVWALQQWMENRFLTIWPKCGLCTRESIWATIIQFYVQQYLLNPFKKQSHWSYSINWKMMIFSSPFFPFYQGSPLSLPSNVVTSLVDFLTAYWMTSHPSFLAGKSD